MPDKAIFARQSPGRASIENERLRCTVDVSGPEATWSIQPKAPGLAPVGPMEFPALCVDGRRIDMAGPCEVRGAARADGSASLTVEQRDRDGALRLRRSFEVFPGQPFVRAWGTLENSGPRAVHVTQCDILDLRIPSDDVQILFHVDQFSWIHREDHFSTHEAHLVSGRAAHEVRMGAFPSKYADATSCGWAALRPAGDATPGLVLGIEFNGKSRLRAWADAHGARVTCRIDDLNHRVEPRDVFEAPAFFVGLFRGDWDEAGYVTHRFAEAHVHPPAPDDRYPWVQYNSWGYGQEIGESQQTLALERCARLGVEAVVMDLGWARRIGDWRVDEAKFPRGLRVISDRARELGIRFGVHIPLAQADRSSPVAREHPDWLIHEGDDYFGASPLCLSHAPCREWLTGEVVRLIDEHRLDYIVQDGEDMVKHCPRADHTHAPDDSNYSNSAEGIDAVIAAAQRLRPNVVWENCEDGGCMLTYKMARTYHTTCLVDNISTYATRQGVYGASYPFSPRYGARYMQDDPTPYRLRSVMFGGPLILMHRITEWDDGRMELVRAAVEEYKQLRTLIRGSRVVHLAPPRYNVARQGWGWDAIQAVSPDRSRSVVLAFRAMGGDASFTVRPRGLDPDRVYRIRLTDAGTSSEADGRSLAEGGITLALGEMSSEKIVLDAAGDAGRSP